MPGAAHPCWTGSVNTSPQVWACGSNLAWLCLTPHLLSLPLCFVPRSEIKDEVTQVKTLPPARVSRGEYTDPVCAECEGLG